MSTLRNPVGPQPPSVYWRRRLLVLLGVIAVIVVIVLIVVRPGSSPDPEPSDTPGETTASTPSGTPTPSFTSASGGDACNPAQVSITAITDANSYAAGVQPKLSMSITNVGSAPCTFDVGTSAQEYVITSGTDRIWSSKDCQTGATANPVVLAPGIAQNTTPFSWDRTRSSTSTCNSAGAAAVAGPDGPTYRLQVKLGEIESEDVAFRLF